MTHNVCMGCTQANARRRRESEHKVHKRLRIVAGAAAGKLLLSGRGETTRPMMEKVRRGPRRTRASCRGARRRCASAPCPPAAPPRPLSPCRWEGRERVADELSRFGAWASGARAPRASPAAAVGLREPGRACRGGHAAAQVRSAVFDMVAAAGGRAGVLPAGSRWLDLFAGTGSVGLEALSRGAAHCRFIELDHWVVSNVRAAAPCSAPNASARPSVRQPVRCRTWHLAALPGKQAV